ncbi:carotenoid oxygenase family protein [Trichocoleus sp. FACHB-262]|uniref:carotenoid oxygenase family protein n=1 Tax=Trichocoleus sp. FACHB-262 TaxID=2692869 RepID=UPI001684A4B3|nr:carotenoid oxygenase family protein [Trichocoleus sp. FACHB-262]MBD2120278.1 carotenoid oxygenase family protein [Trichocoleus sp. FACHB-262]
MKQQQARFVDEPCRKNFVPRSVIKTSREEITDLPLTVRRYAKNVQGDWELVAEGDPVELPAGLHGYYFVVGALFQSDDRPQEDGTPLYTGDGMIYRLGFEHNQAILKTRIAKTPCYYADIALTSTSDRTLWKPETQFSKKHWLYSYFAAFRNGGPSRFSLLLGGRNQLNTALLRVADRLIVTIDAGRPYEVDPDSLELIVPIGSTSQWLGILPFISSLVSWVTGSYPFDVYINSAHPVTDCTNVDGSATSEPEFFTTNYSTGYNGLFRKPVNWVFDQINRLSKAGANAKEQFGRFTDLICYHFQKENLEPDDKAKQYNNESRKPVEPYLRHWRLVHVDGPQKGQPVVVEQSLHQVAITENFILFADIAFKMEFSQIFSPFFVGFLKLKIFQRYWSFGAWVRATFLRDILPLPRGILYVVKREDLDKYPSFVCTNEKKKNQPPLPLPARQIILPYEISHFAADYSNPEDKIILHVGHPNGWDVTQWITRYDHSVLGKPCLRSDLEGMQVGTTDLGALAKYIINGSNGEVEKIQVLRDVEATWSPSIYTHSELSRDDSNNQENQVRNIYWITWGFSWELVPQQIYDAYKSRGYRTIPIENLPNQDKPLTLLRLDTQTMTIADSFQFPVGYFASSPQFIPSSESLDKEDDPSQHDFIVCTVLSDNSVNEKESSDEFWVFPANNFQETIYRFGASSQRKPLNLALTLHTTWMKEICNALQRQRYGDIEVRQRLRRESVLQDYKSRLQKANPVIRELFDEIVYGYFVEQFLEKETLDRLQQKDYQVKLSNKDTI